MAIRYRVPPSLMPWSALGEPDRRQPTAPDQSVFGQTIDRVLAARRNEATRRRSQRRHHVPVHLDEENQSAGRGPAHAADNRAHSRRGIHRIVPAGWQRRRRALRNCCSSLADDTCRLLASARMTTRSDCSRSPSRVRTTCRNRRATRWRSTADPTALPMISPTRGPLPTSSFPRRICTITSDCTARTPYFTVASNSVDRLIRLRAGSTAKNLTLRSGRQRATALTAPVGHDRTPRAGPHPQAEAMHAGTAPVIRLEGPLALGHGVLLVVSRSGLSQPSGRSRFATAMVRGSVGGGLAAGRRGPQARQPRSQPYRRLSGDCLRVLTRVRWVKLGLSQRTHRQTAVKTFVLGSAVSRRNRTRSKHAPKNFK
jgi:hypothetical protein